MNTLVFRYFDNFWKPHVNNLRLEKCIYDNNSNMYIRVGNPNTRSNRGITPPPFSITYIYILDQICLFQVIKQPILYVCVCVVPKLLWRDTESALLKWVLQHNGIVLLMSMQNYAYYNFFQEQTKNIFFQRALHIK